MLRSTRRGFLQAPDFAVTLQQVAVMHQSIEEWRDDDGVTEQARPIFERSIRARREMPKVQQRLIASLRRAPSLAGILAAQCQTPPA